MGQSLWPWMDWLIVAIGVGGRHWGNSVLLGQITFPNMQDPVYLQGKVGEIMVRKSQDSRGFFKASAFLCVSASIWLVKKKTQSQSWRAGLGWGQEVILSRSWQRSEFRKRVQIWALFLPLFYIFLGIIKLKIITLPPWEKCFEFMARF